MLRIILDSTSMMAVTAMAPIKAATSTATKPPILMLPTPMPPPNNSKTRATPRPEPLLTPSIEGSASGLRNTACMSNPHTDNAPPAKRAVSDCGKRDSSMIKRQLALATSPPLSILKTEDTGILTAPLKRLSSNKAMVPIPAKRNMIASLFKAPSLLYFQCLKNFCHLLQRCDACRHQRQTKHIFDESHLVKQSLNSCGIAIHKK